jgi:hypothetical protein
MGYSVHEAGLFFNAGEHKLIARGIGFGANQSQHSFAHAFGIISDKSHAWMDTLKIRRLRNGSGRYLKNSMRGNGHPKACGTYEQRGQSRIQFLDLALRELRGFASVKSIRLKLDIILTYHFHNQFHRGLGTT